LQLLFSVGARLALAAPQYGDLNWLQLPKHGRFFISRCTKFARTQPQTFDFILNSVQSIIGATARIFSLFFNDL